VFGRTFSGRGNCRCFGFLVFAALVLPEVVETVDHFCWMMVEDEENIIR